MTKPNTLPSVGALSPTGTTLGTYGAAGIPERLAFDGANMWVVGYNGSIVTKLSLSGTTVGTYAAPPARPTSRSTARTCGSPRAAPSA
jgi:hypothetical protein